MIITPQIASLLFLLLTTTFCLEKQKVKQHTLKSSSGPSSYTDRRQVHCVLIWANTFYTFIISIFKPAACLSFFFKDVTVTARGYVEQVSQQTRKTQDRKITRERMKKFLLGQIEAIEDKKKKRQNCARLALPFWAQEQTSLFIQHIWFSVCSLCVCFFPQMPHLDEVLLLRCCGFIVRGLWSGTSTQSSSWDLALNVYPRLRDSFLVALLVSKPPCSHC